MEPSSGGEGIGFFRKVAQDKLIKLLRSCPGKKDVFIDEELLRPFDRFAGVSLLKSHDVDNIFKLESTVTHKNDMRVYITRPYISRMKMIVEHIKKDKEKRISVEYRIAFTPKSLAICESFLEEEGVYGDIKTDELEVDFIVLDDDVMSLEMPHFYQDFYQNGDYTWISTLARTISTIQFTHGTIPSVACFGQGARMAYELLEVLMSNENEYIPPDGPEISSLIIIDREIDCVTPLCSQLSYEGILSDVFSITSGYVDFDKEVTGNDKNTRVLLDSSDPVFKEIRDMHFTSVFPLLSKKVKHIQTGYNKGKDAKSLSEMKDFVSQDLKSLKQQHKSLSLHVSVCESIVKKKIADNVEKRLRTEQNLLEDTDIKDTCDFIEECINRQLPAYDSLRLICLVSQIRGGSSRLKSLKHQYLQSYGYSHIITFNNLTKAGIYTEGIEKRDRFQRFKKKLNLIPKNPASINLAHPNDMSYVFGGGYSPLSIKIIEKYLVQGMMPLERILEPDGIPTYEYRRGVSPGEYGYNPTTADMRKILVVFFGGCTHSEMSALRFFGKQLGYNFLIITTGIMTGASFVKTFAPL